MAFFARTASAKLFRGEQAKLLKQISDQEHAHVSAIRAAMVHLDAKPRKISPHIPRTDAHGAAQMALSLENLAGLRTYNGLMPMLTSKVALAQTGAVVQIDARHAAALALLDNRQPTEGAFDKPISRITAIAEIAAMSRR